MAKLPKGPSMEEYAAKKSDKKVTGVNISKAKNGFIVRVEHNDYSNSDQTVYQDIAGVLECVKSKLGGSK